jgi:hypothetical protein
MPGSLWGSAENPAGVARNLGAMHRFAPALVVLLLGLIAAPLAQAQLGPNVPTPLTQDPPPPPAPAPKPDDGGISTLQQVLIFGGAGLVLAAIAFFIVRDARRVAPVAERPRRSASGAAGGATGAAKAARERERQQRAKRARAKAARQQRKRNRPG